MLMSSLRQSLSATFVALSLLAAGTASADPCDTYITTEMNWVRDTPSHYWRYLLATVISLNDNSKASYTEATLSKYSPSTCIWWNGACIPVPASLSTSSSTSQYFNQNCAQVQGDPFPFCVNPFSNGSYTSKVTLNSTSLSINPDPSGDATITVSNLTCQNGVMYGFGSGTTPGMYVIKLTRHEDVIIP
jgi:hypothetical protein